MNRPEPLSIPWRHIQSLRARTNPFGRFRHVTTLSQPQLTHSPASVGDERPSSTVHLASPIVDNLYYPVSPHALNQTKHARSSVIRSQGIGRANSATRREIQPRPSHLHRPVLHPAGAAFRPQRISAAPCARVQHWRGKRPVWLGWRLSVPAPSRSWQWPSNAFQASTCLT
jgi:hypothetical protein